MPNLTIIPMQQCTANYVDVPSGTSEKVYRVRLRQNPRDWVWACECSGYRHRGKCSHQTEAKARFCGWHQQYSDELQTVEGVCPKCGAPAEWVMVGV